MINYIELEKRLDIINGDFGTKENYCLFCKSNKYDSKVGIVHFENCVIIDLRKIIKENEKESKY